VTLLPSVDLVLDPRLREYDVGIRQGLTMAEFGERHPEAFREFVAGREIQVAGAETTSDVCARMSAVLNEAATEVGLEETGVIVGHGASLRAGLLAFLQVPASHAELLAGMANCAWAVLELRGGRGWQIVDYNAQTLPEPVQLADDPHV
jgi:probable phosphoglycerate mutase